MRRLVVIPLLLIATQVVLAAAPVPQKGPLTDGGPAVSFDGQNIVVSGATSGDGLYAGGVEVRGGPYGLSVETPVAGVPATADGTARLDMKARIAARSIWIVVNGNGGYTVSPGPGMVRRQMDLPGAGGIAGNDGQVRRLVVDRISVYVFLVRPGSGMWSGRMSDGRAGDDDHAMNGSISGSLQNLQPVAGTLAQAPEHLMPGDVLFVVDPYSLEYAVARQGR